MKWYNKLGKFFAVVFSVVYSLLLTLIIVLYFASSFISGNIYSNILKSVDLKEIKLSEIDPRLINYFGSDATLEDVFVDSLMKAGIDKSVAKELSNNEEIKEVVGEFISECIDYSINKDELPEIKESDVEVILDNINVKDIPNEEINKDEIMNYVKDVNKNAKDYLLGGN